MELLTVKLKVVDPNRNPDSVASVNDSVTVFSFSFLFSEVQPTLSSLMMGPPDKEPARFHWHKTWS